MNLIEAVDKFLNEHCSAQVLRDHVALATEEKTILEKRITEVKAQLDDSKKEVIRLRFQLERCNEENNKKQQLIERLQQKPGQPLRVVYEGPSPGDFHGVM
jgi:ribosomal protein L29